MAVPHSRGPDLDWRSVPTEIHLLLKRAFEQRRLLTVHVGADPQPYSSAILEVACNGRYLVLDELVPRRGHERLARGATLAVRTIVDNVTLRFASRVTDIGGRDGLPFYRVSFPAGVSYPQRRRGHRLAVPLAASVRAMLLLPDERELTVELRDIAPGGVCLRLAPADNPLRLARGDVALCRIAITTQREIVADVEIRHLDVGVRDRVPRIGARFLNLGPTGQRKIEQYCAELDRRQRRAI